MRRSSEIAKMKNNGFFILRKNNHIVWRHPTSVTITHLLRHPANLHCTKQKEIGCYCNHSINVLIVSDIFSRSTEIISKLSLTSHRTHNLNVGDYKWVRVDYNINLLP